MSDFSRAPAPSTESFAGFLPLDGNFLYCPNQFFDVVLPNASRGTLRLVAYVLRKTLGWLDRNGQPIQQDVAISYRELIENAGISRGAIRPAIDEAVQAGFLTCTTEGRPDRSTARAVTASYRLRWDESGVYAKDLKAFRGFFVGEGHRTPIPNAFFDQVVCRESLAVVKVVGCVLRHTVGYQNQFGGRRSDAPLSHNYIHAYARISNGKTLTAAINAAIVKGYVRRVASGSFGSQNHAATYAVNWLTPAADSTTGSKIPAPTGTESPVGESLRFKKPNGSGSECPAANRFKNPNVQRTGEKDTDKQQGSAVAVDEKNKAYQLLKRVGFDEKAAQTLAERHSPAVIEEQIAWLDNRHAARNRLGLLRRAIEENWSRPESDVERVKQRSEAAREQERRKSAEEAAHAARMRAEQVERKRRRQAALRVWQRLNEEDRRSVVRKALNRQQGDFLRNRFQRNAEYRLTQCLDVLARQSA